MPGRRFRKDIVTNFFANGGHWSDDITEKAFLYIGPIMTERIMGFMQIQNVPTLEELLEYTLLRSAQAFATGNFNSRYEALQAVIGMLSWNPRHMTCDQDTGYLRRIPNRFAFNVIAELVAEAKVNQNFVISAPAMVFLGALTQDNVRRNVICRFNEGVNHHNPLEPNPNSPFLCRETPSNTAGGGVFAQTISKCPCHESAEACGGDGHCAWDNAIGKCLPSTATTGGVGRRIGSRFRSLQTGDVYSTYTRGRAAHETALPPPDLAAQWNSPNGVQHAGVGGRRFYAV